MQVIKIRVYQNFWWGVKTVSLKGASYSKTLCKTFYKIFETNLNLKTAS